MTMNMLSKEVIRRSNEIYVEQKKPPAINNDIPQFYFPVPSSDDIWKNKIHKEARTNFLQQSGQVISNETFQEMYNLLVSNQDLPKYKGQVMIDYLSFMEVKTKTKPVIELDLYTITQFFTTKIFANLYRTDDPKRRMVVDDFFNYVVKCQWMHQTRIGLSLYDHSGLGVINELEFESYIVELIPTLTMLHSLENSFVAFYVVSAVRRFFFFLDLQRTNKIKVEAILTCDFLQDLLELREENMSLEAQQRNWFSAKRTLEVYGIYLALDTNHNGMLSKEELSRYGSGRFTPAFMERVFIELLTYGNEIDYKTYLDFVLAVEYRDTMASKQFMFRVLDTRKRNFIDLHDINYFFRHIQDEIKKQNQDFIKFDDFKSEIFDMVKPVHPYRITFADLINCGKSTLIMSLLIDTSSFFSYEYREMGSPTDTEDNEDDDDDENEEEDEEEH